MRGSPRLRADWDGAGELARRRRQHQRNRMAAGSSWTSPDRSIRRPCRGRCAVPDRWLPDKAESGGPKPRSHVLPLRPHASPTITVIVPVPRQVGHLSAPRRPEPAQSGQIPGADCFDPGCVSSPGFGAPSPGLRSLSPIAVTPPYIASGPRPDAQPGRRALVPARDPAEGLLTAGRWDRQCPESSRRLRMRTERSMASTISRVRSSRSRRTSRRRTSAGSTWRSVTATSAATR